MLNLKNKKYYNEYLRYHKTLKVSVVRKYGVDEADLIPMDYFEFDNLCNGLLEAGYTKSKIAMAIFVDQYKN